METKITFLLNEEIIEEKLNPSAVLLDFLRVEKHLTGTKEVCKEGDCGACAVLLGELTDSDISYKVINSCLYPIQKANGKHVVTIEGLNQETLSPVQESFMDEGASQCGFCTPGFIISATGYLINTESYNYDEAINSVAGNICRCTGYNSIKKSLKRLENINNIGSIKTLIDEKVLPEYFLDVELKLNSIRVTKEKVKRNSNVQFISGGTDLFVQKPDIILESDVEFIHEKVPRRIELKDNSIIISGSATIDMLNSFFTSKIKSKQFDKLFKMFASLPIRNSATIAGNIVNASPIADLTISLLALNAKLELRNSKGEKRYLLLKDFYKGYKTLDKKNDEIIENIIIPKLDEKFNFEKVSKRTYLDIASVNSAAMLRIEDNKILEAHLSAGGVAPIPFYLSKTSSFLEGKTITTEIVNETVKTAKSEISPISDIRGSKEYKTLLLTQLIKAHFIELFPYKISPEELL